MSGTALPPELQEQGLALRRDVLGSPYADGSMARATDPVSRDFQAMVNGFIWGSVWSRPGLDLRARSIATVTILALRGQEAELELHLATARRNGVSDDELRELFIHLLAYAGAPVANLCFAALRRLDAKEAGHAPA